MGHFTVKADMKFDARKVIKEYEKSLDVSYKDTAKLGASLAYRYFIGQHQGLGTGEMKGSFQARRSKYGKKGGWIYGTFGSGGGGKWEDSLGGRAVFFEYGRSAPGKGRPARNRGSWKNTGARGDGQPPRPFMRPSYTVLRHRFPGIVSAALRGSSKTLNRMYK